MDYEPLSIPDVLLIKPKIFEDQRGSFWETYQAKHYAEIGINFTFYQDNQTHSHHGVLRGLHFQIFQPQGKLVRVAFGEIFDVAVDLRRASPTFARWIGVYLSADSKHEIWIPPGFAHGFYVTGPSADVLYKVTRPWHPEFERTLLWSDQHLGINWPLVDGKPPLMSEKDKSGLSLDTVLSGESDPIYSAF